MSKKLRTPIIKPRRQGGTFYTFGSALEDIGLNINESSNKVELSHYVLLNIPNFSDASVFGVKAHSDASTFKDASVNPGDYILAEVFQDYVLNKETAMQNDIRYDLSRYQTVSEEVFWSWVFKDSSIGSSKFSKSTNNGLTYYYETDSSVAVAFGRITAGSQRTNDYGIYNESFAQIPSSYGRMRVLFKNNIMDPNFIIDASYGLHNIDSSTLGMIENITSNEFDETTKKIKVTGIDARAICDNDASLYYTSDKAFTVEFDINNLQSFYDRENLTYDDIGMNKTDVNGYGDASRNFVFNAILVYYSIYNADGTARLATNAYGLYVLDNSLEDTNGYMLPTMSKKTSTLTEDGTAFSFRLNIKPTSAYAGDVIVDDNSTEGFGNATNFDDILRNLAKATDILRANTVYIGQLVNTNKTLNNIVLQMTTKIEELQGKVYDLETRVSTLEHN
jgi:hypothetical protein